MLQSFDCPNCQASLDYNPETKSVTVRCPYCGSTVIVPDSLRDQHDHSFSSSQSAQYAQALADIAILVQNGRKIEAIKLFRETFNVGLKEAKEVIDTMAQNETIHLGDTPFHTQSDQLPANVQTGNKTGCVLGILFIILGIAAAGAYLFLAPAEQTSNPSQIIQEIQTFTESAGETEPLAEIIEPTATSTLTFADVVLQFGGEEGIGPGFFNDTRQLAVDGEGNIYTGDYQGGRIQVFDSTGKFLTTWNAGEDLYMRGMVIDQKGTVYIVNTRDVEMYNGMSGEFLGVVPISGGNTGFETAVTGSDGNVYFVGKDRLVRLDNQGNITLDISEPFASIPDFNVQRFDVAVDGTGDIILLGNEVIYRLDSKGQFVDQFGSKGDAEDQFKGMATSLAVDGQGRIYINDFDGIKVFDGNGRYLAIIDSPGIAFDMLVTSENDLLFMDRNGNEVRKYRFNE